jgi:hypothetical protein
MTGDTNGSGGETPVSGAQTPVAFPDYSVITEAHLR